MSCRASEKKRSELAVRVRRWLEENDAQFRLAETKMSHLAELVRTTSKAERCVESYALATAASVALLDWNPLDLLAMTSTPTAHMPIIVRASDRRPAISLHHCAANQLGGSCRPTRSASSVSL